MKYLHYQGKTSLGRERGKEMVSLSQIYKRSRLQTKNRIEKETN